MGSIGQHDRYNHQKLPIRETFRLQPAPVMVSKRTRKSSWRLFAGGWRTILIGMALISLIGSGCSKTERVSQVLVGNWELTDSTKIAEKINQNTPTKNDDTDSESTSRMNLIFRSNGTLETNTLMGQIKRTKNGVWKLNSSGQDGKLLSVECQLNQQTTVHEIEFLDSETIRLIPPNLAGLTTKLTFRRTDATPSK